MISQLLNTHQSWQPGEYVKDAILKLKMKGDSERHYSEQF